MVLKAEIAPPGANVRVVEDTLAKVVPVEEEKEAPEPEKKEPRGKEGDGKSAVAEVPAILAVVQNAHLADFSRQEWQTLLGYLQRMLVNGKSMQNADAVTG